MAGEAAPEGPEAGAGWPPVDLNYQRPKLRSAQYRTVLDENVSSARRCTGCDCGAVSLERRGCQKCDAVTKKAQTCGERPAESSRDLGDARRRAGVIACDRTAVHLYPGVFMYHAARL